MNHIMDYEQLIAHYREEIEPYRLIMERILAYHIPTYTLDNARIVTSEGVFSSGLPISDPLFLECQQQIEKIKEKYQKEIDKRMASPFQRLPCILISH